MRYWIVAAVVPRVAAQQPMAAQPQALDGAVMFERFNGITRTAWIKTALVTEPRAQQVTICANQNNQDFLHFCATFIKCSRSELRSVVLSAAAAAVCAMITTSRLTASAWCRRKASRTCRLMRLRRTALVETLRPTFTPSRACGWALGVAHTRNNASLLRRPFLNTAANAGPAGTRRKRNAARVLPAGFRR